MFSEDQTLGLKVKVLAFPFLLWEVSSSTALLSGTKISSDGRVTGLFSTSMVNPIDLHIHLKQEN